jgi:N-acetylglucosamine kinase-like BadF-type ATPase
MSGVPLFLGVDGGGSKTLAVLVDASGQEVGRGQSGSTNYEAIGITDANAHLCATIEDAAKSIDGDVSIRAAWFGMAGVDRPHDHTVWMPHLSKIAERIELTNDAELLLSALPERVGIALIAGTGSIALGCNSSGDVCRVGGWGHFLGDEGSGYAIGRRALQALTHMADGRGEATSLLDRILSHWGVTSAYDIMSKVYPTIEKAEVASLANIVFAAAREHDSVAKEIVNEAISDLAHAALTVSGKLGFMGQSVSLAVGGGLLINEPLLRDPVLARITERQPLVSVAPVSDAALSAARWCALHA